MDARAIADRLLDMDPDPIPKLVLLKEFKGASPGSAEYQNAYDRVCGHPFVKRLEDSQNGKGFWPSFHGETESAIRRLLSYGLEKNHICLKRASEYTIRLLHNEEVSDRSEKQDNIRWWPEMFLPLVCAATLSLTDGGNGNLAPHRKRWAAFAENAFAAGGYDREGDGRAQNEYFGFKTKCVIPPFNYYNLLLLAPRGGESYISDDTDQALIDYCLNEADGLGYVYNKTPGALVKIGAQNRDSRDFCHWIRALSIVSQFRGWAKYERKYADWIWDQRNADGLWEFPKKFDHFALSNSWRGRNGAIDSTIFMLRFLLKKQAY